MRVPDVKRATRELFRIRFRSSLELDDVRLRAQNVVAVKVITKRAEETLGKVRY